MRNAEMIKTYSGTYDGDILKEEIFSFDCAREHDVSFAYFNDRFQIFPEKTLLS